MTMVSPTDLSTLTDPLLTKEQARGDLQREYRERFANLPGELRMIKLCSDAGFMKTVVRGQYFVTIDEAELAKLDCLGSCREYTLPRDDELSKAKTDPWKRRSLQYWRLRVSNHHGRYGIEITINSVLDDGSQSSFMIFKLLNKDVPGMSEKKTRKPRRRKWSMRGETCCDRKKHHRRCHLLRQVRYHTTCVYGSTSNQESTTKHSFEVSKLLRHDEKKTEQSNSKLWHRCSFHNSSLPRDICKEEEVTRRDFSIAWIPAQPRLFFTFEQFKAILEEIQMIQHCKKTCCYRQVHLPRWKLPRHALHHPTRIDSGWKRCQERETDGTLHSRESNARTCTQAKGLRRDEAHDCS